MYINKLNKLYKLSSIIKKNLIAIKSPKPCKKNTHTIYSSRNRISCRNESSNISLGVIEKSRIKNSQNIFNTNTSGYKSLKRYQYNCGIFHPQIYQNIIIES